MFSISTNSCYIGLLRPLCLNTVLFLVMGAVITKQYKQTTRNCSLCANAFNDAGHYGVLRSFTLFNISPFTIQSLASLDAMTDDRTNTRAFYVTKFMLH